MHHLQGVGGPVCIKHLVSGIAVLLLFYISLEYRAVNGYLKDTHKHHLGKQGEVSV